jgi:RNA polymerase sigma-70 factor (ECF subfamily)
MSLRIAPALCDDLYRRAGAAKWQLPPERFAAALERSAAKAFAGRSGARGEVDTYLRSLRLEELALACACEAGIDAAWDHFVLEYRPVLYRSADALDPSGGAREIADSLYADLYGIRDAGGERQSLFRYFHGRSSLATWLRAVLAQRQVDRVRRDRRTAPLPEVEPAALPAGPPDPDRVRLLPVVLEALNTAVARLDSRERLRLCYYYTQGLTLAEAGRLLGEHEASVSRHLSAARKAIRRGVEALLSERGLSAAEIDRAFECVAGDAGTLDLDELLGSAGARNADPAVQRTATDRGAGAPGVNRRSSR